MKSRPQTVNETATPRWVYVGTARVMAFALLLALTGCSSSSTEPDNGGGPASGGSGFETGGTTASTAGMTTGAGTANVSTGSGGQSSSSASSVGGVAGAGMGVTGSVTVGSTGSGGSTGTGGGTGTGSVTAGGTGSGGATAGSTGSGGATGAGGASMGGSGGASGGGMGGGGPVMHQELILYNDVPGELLYVNNANPDMNWRVSSGSGRDIQLVGNGRLLFGKSNGWEEYRLSDGVRVASVTNLSGTQDAHRLADGTTMVASVSGNAIVLRMADATGAVQRQISYTGYNYVRCVRPTKTGNFMVTADTKVFEGNPEGQVVWEVTVPGSGRHVWKAMRLANGNTAVATGYDKAIRIYDPDEQLLQTINAPDSVYPEFFADFHVMTGGNYFVVNSQADRTEDRSIQLLEFSPTGELVWQQKQPNMVRSLEAAIVLDGLDTTKLYIEPEGELVAAEASP